jgi:hypothetical protein
MPVRASFLPSSTACVLGVVPLGTCPKGSGDVRLVLERMGLCHSLGKDLRGLVTTTSFYKVDLGSGRSYPLNLSISISGGKETNRDCLSNGE